MKKDDIFRGATNVIRKNGESALTVRNIAKELDCSTQPIYSEFKNLEQLREELSDSIRKTYLHFCCSNYKDLAQRFLLFAKKEKELFRFIYLRRRRPEKKMLDDANYERTVSLLSRNLELSPDRSRNLIL